MSRKCTPKGYKNAKTLCSEIPPDLILDVLLFLEPLTWYVHNHHHYYYYYYTHTVCA